MTAALEWAFWSCLVLGLYPYFGYPMLAWVLGRLRTRPVVRDEVFLPTVTVITAARNEATCIEATVRNKLAQDYPADRLDMIVVSDASDDGTDAIVERLAREHTGRVRLLRQEPREGKTAALNRAVPQGRGDIIVFADANSIYRPDTVRKLVRNFADPGVGYVTGKMVYVNRDGSLVGDGCSAYMKYENWLRSQETRIGSIVGVDGGVDAVRRSLYRPMRADQLPDFVLPLGVVEQGARAVYEPGALLEEDALASTEDEFRMRVRVSLRALWGLWDMRRLFNPLGYGLFAFELASHKLLRYLSFLPLGVAFLACLALSVQDARYAILAAGQVLLLVLAARAWQRSSLEGASFVTRMSFYFVLVNLASAVATGRFLRGEKVVLWQPRAG